MSNEMQKEPDTEAAIAALEKLAETPNEKRLTLKERIAEPRMYDAIKRAQRARHSPADIARILSGEGIEISPATLGVYLREIEREQRGDNNAKSSKKRTDTKPKETDNSAGTAKGTAGGDNGAKPETAGKTLTRKPGMGGGFSPENL